MTERVLKFHSEIDTFDHELVLCEGPGPIYIFLFVFSFIYLLVYLFIFINILICICICVYIHIHINVHIHIYIISYHISHTPCSHIAVFTRLLSLLGHPCLIWTSSLPLGGWAEYHPAARDEYDHWGRGGTPHGQAPPVWPQKVTPAFCIFRVGIAKKNRTDFLALRIGYSTFLHLNLGAAIYSMFSLYVMKNVYIYIEYGTQE